MINEVNMGGKQSKSATHSDTKASTSSSSSNTSRPSRAAGQEDALSKLGDAIRHVGEFLTPEEEARLRVAKPASKRGEREEALRAQEISPPLTTFFVPPQRTANYLVLTGRPEDLIRMLEKDPMMFFKKHEQIEDAAGQVFYDVSPADLISFLCDDDMQMQVNVFAQHLSPDVRAEFFAKWQEQVASRGRGGADLVMVAGDEAPQYASICGVTNTFMVLGETRTTEWSLLKNPDGIICSKSPDNQLHWYYANPDTQTLEPIDIPKELLAEHQAEYDAFAARMTNMEPMTARRSGNQEHALIEAIMRQKKSHKPIHLHREGIHYRQDGIDYVDTEYDFNRIINAYLKCIRLYNNNHYAEGDRVWRAELGHVQREVMWLIQRYCEKNRIFWPLADDYKASLFIRTQAEIYNYTTGTMERIFDGRTGKFPAGFGVDDSDSGFAIYKGRGARAARWRGRGSGAGAVADLVAVTRLCKDAIQNRYDFRPEIFVSASPGASA